MGDGQPSSPQQFKINEAFAIGNLYGNNTELGVACTVKTVEQDTGIYINHFIVVNFTGFENMVAAIGGVPRVQPQPDQRPELGADLAAGHHLLTPAQALGYVRARYTLGNGSDLDRIGRQQAFMSSLVSQVKSELCDPMAIYRFLDATTKSLTVDSQLGGITGLYNLGETCAASRRGSRVFTVPNFPRGEVVPVIPRTSCGRSQKITRSSSGSRTTCRPVATVSPSPRPCLTLRARRPQELRPPRAIPFRQVQLPPVRDPA